MPEGEPVGERDTDVAGEGCSGPEEFRACGEEDPHAARSSAMPAVVARRKIKDFAPVRLVLVSVTPAPAVWLAQPTPRRAAYLPA